MDWNSAILWGLIGIASTIFFGFIFSYIFYRKGLKQKKVICTTSSTVLISDNLSNYKNLKILYDNEYIKTLTSTTINFKNIGNDKIELDDIVPSDPIIISTSGKFLNNEDNIFEVKSTNEKVKSKLEYIDDSNFNLIFDFFPPECELSVTVLHSEDILITGDLKVGEFEVIKNHTYNTTTSIYKTMPKSMYHQVIISSKICFVMSLTLLISLLFFPQKETSFLITHEIIYIFPIMGILLIILYMLIDKFDNKISSHQSYENDEQ